MFIPGPKTIAILVCCGLLPLTLAAQESSGKKSAPAPKSATASATPSAHDYSAEDIVVESNVVEETFHADGRAESTDTMRARVQTQSGLTNNNVLRTAYASKEGTVEFAYVRVHKPDGRVIETSPAEAQDVAAPETQAAPMYSDIRIRELPVKGLSVGDVLEWQVRETTTQPLAPGQFWGTWEFPKDNVVLDFRLEIRVPKSKPVVLYSPGHPPVKLSEGEDIVYRWQASQLERTKSAEETRKERAAKAMEKRKKPKDEPGVMLSTFQSWQQMGEWYQSLANDRTAVTPEIKAKADELVKGITGDEARMRALYDFVASDIQYVGVDLGIGRYQPHAAATVLENQYGDCKDKHTLLAALLKAEGYTADTVLIHPELKLVPEVAMPLQFDHMITAVEWKGSLIWLDSTPGTAPFQMLMTPLRDKDALLVPEHGAARIAKTPARPPFEEFSRWTSEGTLNEKGEFSGHFRVESANDMQVPFRMVFRNVPAAQRDQVWDQLLAMYRFGGEHTGLTSSPPGNLDEPFAIDFDYTRKDFGDWPNHKIYPMLPVWVFPYDKDADPPEEDFDLGGNGNHTYISRIKLPPGWSAQLPAATHYSNAFVEYSNEYAQDKGTLVSTRKASIKLSTLKPEQWNDYLAFKKAVDDDEDRMVQVLAPGEHAEAEEDSANPEAERLVREGYAAAQRHDVAEARKDFEEAEKLNPHQLWLHSGFAFCLQLEKKFDKAVDEYEVELAAHPQIASSKFLADVNYIVFEGGTQAAIRLLQAVLKADPGDPALEVALATLLVQNGRAAEAVPVAEAAAKKPNADVALKTVLANAYLGAGRAADAEPLLRDVLTNAKEPMALNNAAYIAAQDKALLADSEIAVKKAIKAMEAESAKVTLAGLKQPDMQRVTFLAAAWDTLGWIYFEQGKVDAAEPWVRAAWVLHQEPTVGLHLGEIWEQQGKRNQAFHMYQLASASRSGKQSTPDTKDLDSRIAAMGGYAGRGHLSSFDTELQDIRTTKISHEQTAFGSNEFFVLLAPSGVTDVKLLPKDKAAVPDAEDILRHAHFEEPFPPGSAAVIVRRGVLSCSAGKNCEAVLLFPASAKVD